jgi:hypothetical protein
MSALRAIGRMIKTDVDQPGESRYERHAVRYPIALALRVAVPITAGGVACLGNMLNIACGKRLAGSDRDNNASRDLIVNRP